MDRETCGAHPELIRSIDQRFDRIEAAVDQLPDRISQAMRTSLEQRLELHLLRAHPGIAPGQILVTPRAAPPADDSDSKTWQKIIATALLIIATAVAAWFGVPASRADAPKITAPSANTQPTP